jgi:hypothetical protein
MSKQSCHLLEYARTTCCHGNDISSAERSQHSRAQAIRRTHATTQQLSLRRISSVFFRIIIGRFPSHLRPDILTRSPVKWAPFIAKKRPKSKANYSALDGFWPVEELAELADGPTERGDMARGVCLFAWNFSATRSTVLTEVCRCCISDSILAYRLDIPLARNRSLHYT